MATAVVFNNSRILQPGAYTQVDASALELAQPFARNTVCIIGAALGGQPNRTYAFKSAAQAQQVFGAGSPLGDAIAFAFRGGVKGGAPVVLGVRADQAGKASGVLNPDNGTNLYGEFDDWGGYGNTYSVSFLPGSSIGVMAVIEGKFLNGADYTRRIDNEPSFSNLIRRINAETPLTLQVLAGGTKASQVLNLATSQDDGRAQVTDAGGTIRTTEAYFYQYPASFLANITDSFVVSYNGTASWSATVNVSTNVFTATGAALTNDTPVYIRGTAIGNLNANTVYYVVSASGDTFSIAATPGGSAIDVAGTFTSARVVLAYGSTTISSALPAAAEGTYTAAGVLETYSQTLTNATFSLTAYGSNIYRVTLTGSDTWQFSQGRGIVGSVFVIGSGDYAGTYQVMHQEFDGFGADKVRVVQKLTSGPVSAGVASPSLTFWPAVKLPRQQPATNALETQLPANGILYRGGQYLTITLEDPGRSQGALQVNYVTQPGDTIETVGQTLATLINQDPDWQGYAIAAASYNSGTYTSTLTVLAQEPGQLANGYKINILVNVQTTLLVSAGGTTLAGGIDPEPPRNALGTITGSLILSGGFDSVPTLQDWLNALESIKFTPLRYLVAAGTSNAGVQAAFADHCREMSSTPQRRERICILGAPRSWTTAEINARAEIFNSERVVFCGNSIRTPDLKTGNIRWYDGNLATAPLIAGVLAAEGNGVSDPITHTFLTQIFDVYPKYDSGSLELDNAIISGVLAIEKDPSLVRESRGYRIVRGITTARSSAVFESISVINQSDFIAQVIRDMEETIFVGRAIEASTLSLIRNQVNLTLQRYSSEAIIYGYDSSATVVSLNPDNRSAVDVSYVVYPAPALEFVLNSQLLLPIPADEAIAG